MDHLKRRAKVLKDGISRKITLSDELKELGAFDDDEIIVHYIKYPNSNGFIKIEKVIEK